MTTFNWHQELAVTGESDATDLLASADRADWALFRMVACVGFVTLLLAGAGTMIS